MAGNTARRNGLFGGRPKGAKGKKTLEKEALRDRVRQLFAKHINALAYAQIQQALGLRYLVTRDKHTGKFIRVGPAMARVASEETIEVWEKDPSTQAWTDLANRVLDKPAEQEQRMSVTLEIEVLRRLDAGRQRNALLTSDQP